MSRKHQIVPIQSTAGAIPVKNDKGETSMQKVKVHRYVSGKRPDYAPRSSSEEESDYEEFVPPLPIQSKIKQDDLLDIKQEYPDFDPRLEEDEKTDPRLLRLKKMEEERMRRIEEPEILDEEDSEEERPARRYDSDSESGEEDIGDEEIERRRNFLRQRAMEKQEEEEILAREDEKESESEESESEYEEYTDSEEELRPRLKPVFVRKKERNTLKDKELAELKERKQEELNEKRAEERRKDTLILVEEEIRKDKEGRKEDKSANAPQLEDVNTDDENEETEYEAWKLRELKRIKRDREEREAMERDKEETDRIHSMTEEERRLEMKLQPKYIMNKASKGKYKFLQKYYHRGAFYLDKEEDVFRRDYSAPTLEDHFDKTILPKVMQVKNFGRSGRTKYTHLVDQDTTAFDSPWASETPQNLKFHSTQAAGVKQVFAKPSTKKRKTE